MSLTTEGRLTVAEAEALGRDSDELTPDNAPLYTTTITITQPAVDSEHATELSERALSEFAFMGNALGYFDYEISEPVAVEA